jgi:hypothetical protein
MRWMLVLCCVGCLVGFQTARAAQTPAALVALSGSSTEQGARQALQGWDAIARALGTVVRLSPGYPKVVTHAEYPEIKPGRYVVVLGVCASDRAGELVEQLEAPAMGGWPEPVRVSSGALPCPEKLGGWTFQKNGRVGVDVSGRYLVSSSYLRNPGTGTSQALVHLYLHDSTKLIGAREVVLPPGCTADVSKDADVIRVEKTCTAEGQKPKGVLRYTVVDGAIADAPDASVLTDLRALVWASTGSEGEAKEAISQWERERVALGDLVTLPPGYPRVVGAEEYAGLPAGKRSVLLAVCPESRYATAALALGAFGHIQDVAVKASGGEPGCPKTNTDQWRAWSKVVRAGGLELTLALHVTRTAGPWELRVYLRDQAGALVEWRREDERTVERHNRGGACYAVPAEPAAGKTRVTMILECEEVLPDGMQGGPTWRQEFTYSIQDGKIAVQEKVGESKPNRK